MPLPSWCLVFSFSRESDNHITSHKQSITELANAGFSSATPVPLSTSWEKLHQRPGAETWKICRTPRNGSPQVYDFIPARIRSMGPEEVSMFQLQNEAGLISSSDGLFRMIPMTPHFSYLTLFEPRNTRNHRSTTKHGEDICISLFFCLRTIGLS
eukprot:symbB.v1.2.034804.t1/scaffold4547.1/size38217/4